MSKIAGAIILAAVCVGIAACGGGGSSSSSGESASTGGESTSTGGGSAPTGSPVKVLVIAPYNNPIEDWGMSVTGAKAAADAINAEGGINGHPVEIESCNDGAVDPNKAANCAREAASGKYIATSVYSIQTEAIFPTLEKAGVPDVGGFADTPPDVESPVAYPIFPGQETWDEAWPYVLAEDGRKSVSGLLIGGSTEADERVLEEGAAGAGIDYKGTVTIPPETTDFTSIAQRIAETETEAAVAVVFGGELTGVLRAAQELGVNVPIATDALVARPGLLEAIGSQGDGIATLDGAPPPSAADKYPAIAKFVEEMEAAGTTGGENYRPPAVWAWFAIHAIAMVGDRINGEITSDSLRKELDTKKPVDLYGLVNWVPGGKGPGKYKRLSNGTVYFGETKDSEVVLKDSFNAFELTK